MARRLGSRRPRNQILILLLGMTQDYGIGIAKRLFCPYSALTLERQ
jgi:hypothetical protein